MSTTLGDLTNASAVKSSNTFTIKINANTLSDSTTLGLARTIIHEGIHARLRAFASRKGSILTVAPANVLKALLKMKMEIYFIKKQ